MNMKALAHWLFGRNDPSRSQGLSQARVPTHMEALGEDRPPIIQMPIKSHTETLQGK